MEDQVENEIVLWDIWGFIGFGAHCLLMGRNGKDRGNSVTGLLKGGGYLWALSGGPFCGKVQIIL